MNTSVMVARMNKELKMLSQAPPPGVSAWSVDGQLNMLEAVIQGPEDTPYSDGFFKLEINIPDTYPNEPPKVRFITPVYHPNIDNGGRICLDTLKMPPKGAWTPSLNIPTLLTTLRLLLANPNPDDPLMPDIVSPIINLYFIHVFQKLLLTYFYTEEYIHNNNFFISKARSLTKKHATSTIDEASIQNSAISTSLSNNDLPLSSSTSTTSTKEKKPTPTPQPNNVIISKITQNTITKKEENESDEDDGEEDESESSESESEDEELMMLAKKKNQVINSNTVAVKVQQQEDDDDDSEHEKEKKKVEKGKIKKDEEKTKPKQVSDDDSDDLFDSSLIKLPPTKPSKSSTSTSTSTSFSSTSSTSTFTSSKSKSLPSKAPSIIKIDDDDDDDDDFKTNKRKGSPSLSLNKKVKK